jgi:GTP-sensing pleiotropic transcriptional regulator CodY
MDKSKFDAPAEFEIEEVKQAAMLNIWITMRQCEIEIFQRLENFVNGNISDYKRSDIEEAIRAMTHIVLVSSTLCADELSLVS